MRGEGDSTWVCSLGDDTLIGITGGGMLLVLSMLNLRYLQESQGAMCSTGEFASGTERRVKEN